MRAALTCGSLRSRLMLPVLLAAGPATILVLLTAAAWRQHELRDAMAVAVQTGRHTASVHTQALGQARRSLAGIATAIAKRPPAAALQEVFNAAIGADTLFQTVGVFDADGQVAYASSSLDPVTQGRLRSLSESWAMDAVAASDYDVDPRSGRLIALIAASVPAPDAGARRIVFATVALSWLHDPSALRLLPAGSVIRIVDRRARVMARVPHEGKDIDETPDAAVVRVALTTSREGPTAPIELVSRDGSVPELGSTAPDALFMTISMPKRAATAEADRLLGYTTIALLFSCVFAGALAWVSSDRLSRDVNALVAMTTRLADGDLGVRVDLKESAPELKRLAQRLDRLAVQSADREREIARRHDHTLQKLSSALEQTADSVFITDREGVIEYVNPAFEAMTGYTRDETIGQTPRLFSSRSHDRKFYEGLWTTILSGQVYRAIVTNRAKDGRLFNEDQTITPIRDAAGTITNFVSTGRDITERRRTEQALRHLNSELENEAGRIAALLHDEAGQFLAFAHITLADVARDVPADLRDRIQEVRRHLDHAEEQLRRVSHELHPRMLDDLGLGQAVRFLSETFSRRSGVPVEVDTTVETASPRALETVCYRLVQEALTNVGKHAKATRVSIQLVRDAGQLCCSIADDGVGFDVAAVAERADFSLGLTLIKDRFEAVGGTLTIVSAPGRGTQLRASAPLES
jgi:two-component system sensor histidine kinase NreB